MPNFRKKPVVIEAHRWNPNDMVEVGNVAAWLQINNARFQVLKSGGLCIGTLEDGEQESMQAKHIASPGDWIIKGVAGEFYPCKPDIFEQTYEPVSEEVTTS